MTNAREIVVPGEKVGRMAELRPGTNTYVEGDDIYALRLGVKSIRGDRLNVISLNGRYEPYRGDMVIGTVVECGPSNWYIDIGSANDVGMHVNDVPWRVEFGETSKYLAVGDSVLLKIVHVDELRKAQVSMKDRQCRKLTGGLIFEVNPSKVPRIVGRQGSMIAMIKDHVDVRIFVGQNGVIWVDGEPEDVQVALEALQKIEAEAHTSGLTDRMKAWLEERRPRPVAPKRDEAEPAEAAADEAEAEAEEAAPAEAPQEERPRRRRAPATPRAPVPEDETEAEPADEPAEDLPKPRRVARPAADDDEDDAEDDDAKEPAEGDAPAGERREANRRRRGGRSRRRGGKKGEE